MRSMQWHLGMLGTNSAFAYRHRETKKNLCRGGRSQQFVCVLRLCSLLVGTYWSLNKLLYKNSLFERKILRKIFGPTNEANGIWRIKTNMELDEIIKHRNIINIFFIIFNFFADRAHQYIYLNFKHLHALNFIMSLFHASTCFEHTCSLSGGQNCIIKHLVLSHLQVAFLCTVLSQPVHRTATYRCDNTRCFIIQF